MPGDQYTTRVVDSAVSALDPTDCAPVRNLRKRKLAEASEGHDLSFQAANCKDEAISPNKKASLEFPALRVDAPPLAFPRSLYNTCFTGPLRNERTILSEVLVGENEGFHGQPRLNIFSE